MDFIEISVRDFKNYTGRKDIKYPQWFAMPNDILEHPDFFEVTGDEFKAFTWIIGLASKLRSETVRIYPAVCERRTTVNKEAVVSTIEKLNGKRWDVRDPYRTRTDAVRDPCIVGNSIELNCIEEEGAPTSKSSFRENKYYKRVSADLREQIETAYPEEFLNLAMIEIQGYLESTGYQNINKLDTFIPGNLHSKWQHKKNKEKAAQPKKPAGGMVKTL